MSPALGPLFVQILGAIIFSLYNPGPFDDKTVLLEILATKSIRFIRISSEVWCLYGKCSLAAKSARTVYHFDVAGVDISLDKNLGPGYRQQQRCKDSQVWRHPYFTMVFTLLVKRFSKF